MKLVYSFNINNNDVNLVSFNQIIELCKISKFLYNQALFQGRDYSRKDLFEKQERACLKPLPIGLYQVKYYKRAKVQKNSHVWLGEDSHYYSVPYSYVGKQVGLHYSKTMVEVYYNHERISSHSRNKIIGGYTTQKNHMPTTHQFVQSWNAESS